MTHVALKTVWTESGRVDKMTLEDKTG